MEEVVPWARHTVVSTRPNFNLRSYMTGRTLAISPSTWTRVRRFPVLAWYRYHR